MNKLDSLRGAVIMFDGPDYVGKTTQLALAKEALETEGLEVYSTRYNGGTPIGEALREVMLSDYERPAMSDLYINLAQQYALASTLQPYRKKGDLILIDRSPLSMIAYQVFGSGAATARGYQAADEILHMLPPDLIISYQAPYDVLAERRRKDSHQKDYFESKPRQYFADVTRGYEAASRHYHARVINASGSIADAHYLTMEALTELANKHSAKS